MVEAKKKSRRCSQTFLSVSFSIYILFCLFAKEFNHFKNLMEILFFISLILLLRARNAKIKNRIDRLCLFCLEKNGDAIISTI